jgi:protein tyrosine/serine phosphatase
LNLADELQYAEEYKGFAESYYATQNVVYLNVEPAFANTPFKEGLVKGLRYMVEHEGPYLVHCTYGMDRTGFTIAVLEALMGATTDEIKADYATTHKNFYNVVNGQHVALTEKQVELLQAIIVRLMQNAYKTAGVDISDFENADLASATEKYLLALGMEKSEIEALKTRLK